MCIFIGIDLEIPWAIECGVFLDSVSGARKDDGNKQVTKMGQSTIHYLRQITPSSPLLTVSALLQIQQQLSKYLDHWYRSFVNQEPYAVPWILRASNQERLVVLEA